MILNIAQRHAITVVAAIAVLTSAVALASTRNVFSSLTVHEWGTFTSVAGADGEAFDWSPLIAPTDLPSFVEHLQSVHFKSGLRGTVRMETPVIYFYSPREETVSVKARFTQGLITEWYPHASQVEPLGQMWVGSTTNGPLNGSIAWDSVILSPSLHPNFPDAARTDHYFAARQTTATPLRVQTPAGEQHEKFLFYRGVAGFLSPVSAKVAWDGQIELLNRAEAAVPATILFERRGDKVGYRIGESLQKRADLPAPELTGTIDSLAHELEGTLVSEGLFQNEAHAVLETWRDSWFEEGSRLLYIVPRSFVDSVLPLSIKPEPQQLTRVFVGRIELITPATQTAIRQAIAANDSDALAKYDRFLEPILNEMQKAQADGPVRKQLLRALYRAEQRLTEMQAASDH